MTPSGFVELECLDHEKPCDVLRLAIARGIFPTHTELFFGTPNLNPRGYVFVGIVRYRNVHYPVGVPTAEDRICR